MVHASPPDGLVRCLPLPLTGVLDSLGDAVGSRLHAVAQGPEGVAHGLAGGTSRASDGVADAPACGPRDVSDGSRDAATGEEKCALATWAGQWGNPGSLPLP